MKLIDNADEQRTLEELLDASKPPVPAACAGLHYLLFTPFRYQARDDSRFRREGATPPVFYTAEQAGTAIAEIAFWRLLFFLESPGTPWPSNPLELTAFAVRYEVALCLDLTRAPYADRETEWLHPTDYAACHSIADAARAMGALAIRSKSARDPNDGINVTLLGCEAFTIREPTEQRTWRMKLSSAGVYARCELPVVELLFGRKAFARDPRVANARWDR